MFVHDDEIVCVAIIAITAITSITASSVVDIWMAGSVDHGMVNSAQPLRIVIRHRVRRSRLSVKGDATEIGNEDRLLGLGGLRKQGGSTVEGERDNVEQGVVNGNEGVDFGFVDYLSAIST